MSNDTRVILGLTEKGSSLANFRMTFEMRDRVDTFAARTGQSRSAFIRHAIEREMQRMTADKVSIEP